MAGAKGRRWHFLKNCCVSIKRIYFCNSNLHKFIVNINTANEEPINVFLGDIDKMQFTLVMVYMVFIKKQHPFNNEQLQLCYSESLVSQS